MIDIQPQISVKVPFYAGQHYFQILKQQRWGAVDHLLLQEISNKPSTAQQLAEESNLPRQLIIEIMIPFMRAGWVELVQQDEYYVFQATLRGKLVASHEELPVAKEPILSFRQFIIDPITEQCYRYGGKKQTFQVYHPERAKELLQTKIAYSTELKFSAPRSFPEISEIYSCVEEPDEEVIGFEKRPMDQPYNQNSKYAIAIVDEENNITGLPYDISEELKSYVLKAAEEKRNHIKLLNDNPLPSDQSLQVYEAQSVIKGFQSHILSTDQYELLFSGDQHKKHLFEMIDKAQSRLIIHSTFINISSSNFEEIFLKLMLAASRSVRIDILWGQTEPESASKKQSYFDTIKAIKGFKERIRAEGLQTQFTIHIEPTGSHAKFIICDHTDRGYCTTLGSCNWLASGFNRFESSVNLQNTEMVVEVITIASRLARGLAKVSTDLSKELAVLANQLRRQFIAPKYTADSAHTITAQLVLQTQHHAFVRQARDEAKDNIFICSHRISNAAERPILAPLKASVGQKFTLIPQLKYGILSGGMKNQELTALAKELRNLGIQLHEANRPMIHAKILTWDNQDAVITSLNWLSAAATGENFGEVGVYLHGDDVALKIKLAFEKST